jgi:hypothetical protein
LAVVTADADSFATPVAIRDVAEADDRAGHELTGRVDAGGRIDDALADGKYNADGVEERDHHRTCNPYVIAPRTMSPMKRCSTTIAPQNQVASAGRCSATQARVA